jgi:hypothetical protein
MAPENGSPGLEDQQHLGMFELTADCRIIRRMWRSQAARYW